MRLIRTALVAVGASLALAGGSAAQMLGPGMMGPGMGFPSAAPAQPQQPPPCIAKFIPLRQEAEKRAGLIQAAAKRKAPPAELCTLFTSFGAAEAKVVKYAADNKAECGIPDQAVDAMKGNHGKTNEMRTKICQVAQQQAAGAGPAGPRGPGLSEAFGTSRGPTLDAGSGGRGTFDTLSGNVLAR